jgi:hypothetical protein
MTVDLNDVPIAHPAEKQAPADLLARLEHELLTEDEVSAARKGRLAEAQDRAWLGDTRTDA